MKRAILSVLLILSFNSLFAQQIGITELVHSLTLNIKERIYYFENAGFIKSVSSTTTNTILEKNQSQKPEYQQVNIDLGDVNSIVYISNDGGLSSFILTTYPKEFEMTKEGNDAILYDKRHNLKIIITVITNTSKPYYMIVAAYPPR